MKYKKETYKEHIEKVTTPIFKKVLQEELSSSMTTTKKRFKIVFRPNNYRRQIEAKEKTNSTIQEIKVAMGILPVELNYNEHTKLLSIKNYKPNITIQYGKRVITGIYHQNIIAGNKETFLIERDSIEELDNRINEIKLNIKEKIDSAIDSFSKKFNLKLPFKDPSWARHEDFIKGESFIDNIPDETIIHDTVYKKVYGKGIEFFGGKDIEPTASLKNYIKNRAIEDISPDIANSINLMMNNITPIVQDLAYNMKTHISVLKGINQSFKKFNNLLNKIEQEKLNRWL